MIIVSDFQSILLSYSHWNSVIKLGIPLIAATFISKLVNYFALQLKGPALFISLNPLMLPQLRASKRIFAFYPSNPLSTKVKFALFNFDARSSLAKFSQTFSGIQNFGYAIFFHHEQHVKKIGIKSIDPVIKVVQTQHKLADQTLTPDTVMSIFSI